MALEDPLERVADRLEPRIVEPRLRVRGRVARGEQQRVALAQRDLVLAPDGRVRRDYQFIES
jgi:hypothetical protein